MAQIVPGVDDGNRAFDASGILFFNDPIGPAGAERPLLHRLTERRKLRDLPAAHGLPLRISENAELAAAVTVTTEP
jgi:hypothetical protein